LFEVFQGLLRSKFKDYDIKDIILTREKRKRRKKKEKEPWVSKGRAPRKNRQRGAKARATPLSLKMAPK
jgi:hypothetical protein